MSKNNVLKKARKEVEYALEKYRIYSLTIPEYKQPKITSTFKIAPSSPSNQFYSSTENAVIKKIDFEIEKERYLKHIEDAINRCPEVERELLIKRYLGDEEVFDYQIYNELGYSGRKYYRLKAKALEKLGIVLGILDVYELINVEKN